MKKLIAVVLVVSSFMFSGFADAQTKIGYVRIDDIVSVMPELAKDKINIDTVGQKFVTDSILPGINYKRDEYTRKLQEYADSTKPKAIRDQILKDLQGLQEELGGADQYVQQVLQFKQQEYLRPFYEKARKAIQAVAKVAPEGDDISLAVLDELKIKIPQNTNKPATNN